MSLKETLNALSTVVPELPAQVDELLDKAEELAGRAQALVTLAEQKKATATGELDKVRHAIEELAEIGRQQEGRPTEAGEAFEQAAQRALEALTDSQGELDASVDEAQASGTQLSSDLQGAGGAGREAHDQAAQAVGEIAAAGRTGQQELAAAAQAADAQADALASTLSTVRERIAQAAESLRERMTQAVEEATSRLDETRSWLHEFQDQHEQALSDQADAWNDGKTALVEELEQAVQRDVHDRVAQAAGSVAELFQAMATEMQQAAEQTSQQREQLGELFEALEQSMEPLPSAVQAVKVAAQKVGLDFR